MLSSRYQNESKNTPCQQHKAATTEMFCSRQTEGSRNYKEFESELQGRGVCKGKPGKERRQRPNHPNQNQRSQEYLQTSPDERDVFVQKKLKKTGN
jgi:hypothetical protein